MTWPLSQDYNEAVQNPASAFSDPELKRGEVVTNPLGIPLPYSGNFADVYQMRCPGGVRWAIKCFTREVPGLYERYQEISRHLRRVQLPFTVDFTFQQQGIRIAGRWYPLLKMQWVEGLTLNEFVRQYLDKPAMLDALLLIWGRMARRLREAGIAHGDLQHGNLLLVPCGSHALAVKLIDYDGMYVPALAGRASMEFGHPSYQHPQRLRERIYGPEVDRLPFLLIAAALHCLKIGGRPLWDKYDNGDNLLFREADLQSPAKSRLFQEMLKLGDPTARMLVDRLLDGLKGGLEAVPLLEEVLPEPVPSSPAEVNVERVQATRPGFHERTDDMGQQAAAPIIRLQKKAPQRRRTDGWLVAAGLAGCLAVGVFAWSQRSPSGPALDIPPPDEKPKKLARIDSKPSRSDEDWPVPVPANPPPVKRPKKRDEPRGDSPSAKPVKPVEVKPPGKPRDASVKKPPAKPSESAAEKPPEPPPDEQAVAEAVKEIKDSFKEDYARLQTNQAAQALAAKLMETGRQTKDSRLKRFALFREARDLAARAAAPALSLEAVEAMAQDYPLNLAEEKVAALQLAGKALANPSAARAFLDAALPLLRDALVHDEYRLVAPLLPPAHQAVLVARDAALKKTTEPFLLHLERLAKRYDAVKPAVRTLKDKPDDPEANRVVGAFWCLDKGEWDRGLPLLAKADELALAEAARKERADPATPADRSALADAWFELAKTHADYRSAMRHRAAHWYAKALSGLTDRDKERVENRLVELSKFYPEGRTAWEHLDLAAARVIAFGDAYLRVDVGRVLSTKKPIGGPVEITAVLRTVKNPPRFEFVVIGHVHLIVEMEDNQLNVRRRANRALGQRGEIGVGMPFNFAPNQWYTVTCRMTEGGLDVSLNGRTVFRDRGKYNLPRPLTVQMGPTRESLEVRAFTVKPISP